MSSTFQVDARHAAAGKHVAGSQLVESDIRATPCGPLAMNSARTPNRGTGVVIQLLAPVHNAAFSSSVIHPTFVWLFDISGTLQKHIFVVILQENADIANDRHRR
jgi:hypothetical protein